MAAPSGPMDAVYRGPRQPVNEAAMRAYLSRFQARPLPALPGQQPRARLSPSVPAVPRA